MSKHSPVHAVTARRVTNGSVSLAVFEQGKADGETIVLVHGWPDTHELWNASCLCWQTTSASSATTAAGPVRAQSPSRVQDYQLSALAGDLFAVIDAVSPGKPVHVLAHDWGGSVETWEAVCEPGAEEKIASFSSISGPPNLDHLASGSGRARPSVVSSARRRRELRRPTPFCSRFPGCAPFRCVCGSPSTGRHFWASSTVWTPVWSTPRPPSPTTW